MLRLSLQPNADFLKANLGDRVRLERFDEDGHALFVDDPVKFNRMVEEFVPSLPIGSSASGRR
jgi:non-heme chloroperoxidase